MFLLGTPKHWQLERHDGIVVSDTISGHRMPGFKPQPCHSLNWTISSTFMCVQFPYMFVYKVGMTIKSSSGTIMRIKCAYIVKHLKLYLAFKLFFFFWHWKLLIKGNPPTLLVWMWIGVALWKTVWSFLKTLKIQLPYDLAIPLLGVYPDKTLIQKDACISVFIAAQFTIANTWKQHKCLSADE